MKRLPSGTSYNTPLKDDFCYLVQRKLHEKRLFQYDLADLFGVSSTFISRILQRQVNPPVRAEYVPKIAEFLDIDWLPEDVVEYLAQHKVSA